MNLTPEPEKSSQTYQLFRSSIVRVYTTATQAVIGTGFLVAPRQVLTCAHVAAAALGRREAPAEPPEHEITFDLPLVQPGHMLTAKIINWQPEQDVAGLELTGDPPPEAGAISLLATDEFWGHPFRAFGFPQNYREGVWATGELRERRADDGWVQLDVTRQTGYAVQRGFSGGPVWDEQLGGVVGITTAADQTPDIRAAYFIPTDRLVEAWPGLSVVQPGVEPPKDRKTVFIVYSREDKAEQEALLNQLDTLKRAGLITPWSEDNIEPGAYWKKEFEQVANRAGVAILLVTASFLNDDFIQDELIPPLLERHKRGDIELFPIIAKPCVWQIFGWLNELSPRPEGGQPVWGSGDDSRVTAKLAAIAGELVRMVGPA